MRKKRIFTVKSPELLYTKNMDTDPNNIDISKVKDIDNFLNKLDEEREAKIAALRDVDISRYKIIKVDAGDLLEVEAYPIWKTSKKRVEDEVKKRDPKAQQAINDRNRKKHIVRLVNLNFPSGVWATYGYAPHEQPKTEDEAYRNFVNFMRRLNYQRKKQGLPNLKAMFTTECTEKDGVAKYHHHMITDICDMDMLENTWGFDGRNTLRALKPDDYGLTGVAIYITKAQINRRKRYSCTRNLEQPKIEVINNKKIGKMKIEIGKRKVEKIAKAQDTAKEEFERLYPDYVYLDIDVKYSDHVSGCYMYVRMKKIKNRRC